MASSWSEEIILIPDDHDRPSQDCGTRAISYLSFGVGSLRVKPVLSGMHRSEFFRVDTCQHDLMESLHHEHDSRFIPGLVSALVSPGTACKGAWTRASDSVVSWHEPLFLAGLLNLKRKLWYQAGRYQGVGIFEQKCK